MNRDDPDFGRYVALTTREGPKRACWNSEIAPHNFEGFFLNMGDMLVKAGDWRTARKIYANARHSPDYASWAYAPVLEERLAQAELRAAAFAQARRTGTAEPGMMVGSTVACTGCHQR